MTKLKLVLSAFGSDEWLFGLTGLTAIILGLIDFLPLITISSDAVLRMLLVAIGLTMLSVVAQTGKRKHELQELRASLNSTHTELFANGVELRNHAKQGISLAKKFVLDTTLNVERVMTPTHPVNDPNHYYHAIFQRLSRKEITYRRIEVIFNIERLEYVISRLLIYEGMDYYVRYYDSPPKPIPVLNLLSIDNESFYLAACRGALIGTRIRRINTDFKVFFGNNPCLSARVPFGCRVQFLVFKPSPTGC